jgi:hypothetical protein
MSNRVKTITPEFDTIYYQQSDGRNPSICLAAKHDSLREALTVRGDNLTQTIETSDLHLNKRRDITFESVQSFGCEQTSASKKNLFLKIAGASVSSSDGHQNVSPSLEQVSRAFSFMPGDDGRVSIDYFYSGERCDIEIVQYGIGDRTTVRTMFRSALTNTNGEWRSQQWNLSNILEPFREYGIIMHADGCDLTRSKDMIIPVARGEEASKEGIPGTDCAVSITSISPNPATDMVTVSTTTPGDETLTMVLSDVFGSFARIVTTGRHSGGIQVTSIDTSNLASGVYSIKLLGKQCTTSKQFVIER